MSHTQLCEMNARGSVSGTYQCKHARRSALEGAVLIIAAITGSVCLWHASPLLSSQDVKFDSAYKEFMRYWRVNTMASENCPLERTAVADEIDWPVLNTAIALEAELRPGSSRDVVIKGGFLARLPRSNAPALPCSNLLYVFEWWMHRTIEEVDTSRFTELIEIREARSAKLLSTVNCPPVRWRDPDEPILAGLMESRPHDSIVVVDTDRLAEALFGSLGRHIGQHPNSHAFALDGRLSGKRIRVVHHTPGGIASIEALDCTLSQGEVGQLIRIINPLAWSCIGSKPHDYSSVRDELIATLLESGGFRSRDLGGISISRANAADGQTLRLSAEREVPIGCHFTPGIFDGSFAPSGTILCTSDGRVETARVHATIRLPNLDPSRLLYEATFDSCDGLSFSYACQDLFSRRS